MVGKDDRFVCSEQGIEFPVGKSLWMFPVMLQRHQIDDIDHTDTQVGQMFPQDADSGQDFDGGNISGAGNDDIRFASLIIAGPSPDTNAGRAVFDRSIHIQPLQLWLFAGDDDVDEIAAAQTFVRNVQQAIRIRWQIDADGIGFC